MEHSLDEITMSERVVDTPPPPTTTRSNGCSPMAELEVREEATDQLLGIHHANYRPEIRHPIECLPERMGSAESLPRVKADTASKVTRKFYETQNEAIDGFEEMDTLREMVRLGTHTEEETNDWHTKLGVRGSFLCNIVILAVKVCLVIMTGSVAFVASLLDSVLDLMSGLTLVVANKLVSKQNLHKYPLGKHTFEPLGTLVFSACMFTASFQLIQYSTQVLLSGSHTVEFDALSTGFICGIILVKFLLHLYCRRYQEDSSAMAALAQDHRNDVLSNTIGLGAALLGKYVRWWADPALAVVITLYIMYTWACTGAEQIMMLSGKCAPPEVLRQLTYAAQHHHPSILFVDTVRAVAMGGTGYQVEVDVVLPPTMELREAHDIGESLQIVLEKLSFVSRAYVHLDYEFDHSPWDHR